MTAMVICKCCDHCTIYPNITPSELLDLVWDVIDDPGPLIVKVRPA